MLTDPNQCATTVKKTGHYRNQCRLLKRQDNSLKILKIILETKTMAPITLSLTTIQTKVTTTTTTTKTVTELKESQNLFICPMRHVGRETTTQRQATLELMQPIDCLPGTEDRKDRTRSKKEPI